MKRIASIVLLIATTVLQLSARNKADLVLENNWTYYGNKAHQIRLATEFKEAGAIDLLVSTDKGEVMCSFSSKVKAGRDTVAFSLKLKPGFYKAEVKDNKGKELCKRTIGFNPEKIKSPSDRPGDFEKFWKGALDELAAVAPEYKLTLDPKRSGKLRNCFVVEMKSLGGVTVKGILYEPVKEGKYPVVITFHGYGTACDKNWCKVNPDANPERIEFQFNVREQGINWRKENDNKWISKGIASKETYYYRSAFMDNMRALDFIWQYDKTDRSRIVAEGASQGGAFTFVTTALDSRFCGKRIKAIAPYEPFLSDFPDYLQIAKWPANDIKARQKQENISDAQVLETLRYFDVKNFVSWIKCPVFMAAGLQDNTCPPHTNFSGYNLLKTKKKYIIYPLYEHNLHLKKDWMKVMDEYLVSFF